MLKRNLDLNKGFTLLELMVAITILSLLAVTGIAAFSGSFSRARDSKAAADVRALSQALELYHTINNQYPPDLDTLISEAGDEDRYVKGGKLPLDKATDASYMYFEDPDLGYCVCSFLFEHQSGAGSNAILSTNASDTVSAIDDAAFNNCQDIVSKEVGDGDHICMFAAQ